MMMPTGFVTLGAGDSCPPRVVVTANASESSSARRATLDREPTESESEFWARVVSTARELAAPKQSDARFGFHPGGLISFDYEPLTTTEQAEADDTQFNVTQALLFTAHRDPSHRLRVRALVLLAEIHIFNEESAPC